MQKLIVVLIVGVFDPRYGAQVSELQDLQLLVCVHSDDPVLVVDTDQLARRLPVFA